MVLSQLGINQVDKKGGNDISVAEVDRASLMQETSSKKVVTKKIDSYVEESLFEQMREMAFKLRTTRSNLVRLGCWAVVSNPELGVDKREAATRGNVSYEPYRARL